MYILNKQQNKSLCKALLIKLSKCKSHKQIVLKTIDQTTKQHPNFSGQYEVGFYYADGEKIVWHLASVHWFRDGEEFRDVAVYDLWKAEVRNGKLVKVGE